MIGLMIIGSTLVASDPLGADNRSFYAQATVVEVTVDNTGGEPFMGNQKVVARITSGE